MKTLQEIIERHDYKKINIALKKRAYELADKLRGKFEELYTVWDPRKENHPECAVDIDGRQYTVKYNIYLDNGIKRTEGTTLCVLPNHLDGTWFSLEYQPHAVYATKTPSSVFLQFLNDAVEILKKIDEVESMLVNEAQMAINAAANL